MACGLVGCMHGGGQREAASGYCTPRDLSASDRFVGVAAVRPEDGSRVEPDGGRSDGLPGLWSAGYVCK
jgi:hypothetical protein